MRAIGSFGAAVAAALLFAAAAHAQTGAAAPAADQTPGRTQHLVEGAKKEGDLTLYSSMQVDSILPLQKAFEQSYGVKIKIWRGSGKDILQRTVTEAQANRAEVDVTESDGFALEALHREGLLAAETSPFQSDLMPEAVQRHHEWIGTRVNISAGAYNTQLVKPADLPKTYPDLLQARFKGQLGIEADDYDWFGITMGLLGEEKGLALFREIVASNGISVRKGHTLLTNLVAAGEVPIALSVFMQNADVAKKKGAPVDWFLIDPAVARFNAVAVAKRAPHPYAALLFYDFMLSEGQRIMLQREFVPTSRKIHSVLDRIKLNFGDPAAVLDQGAKWQRLYSEVVRNGRR
jgi:iron(III) transport system substrate-binding protein